MSLTFTSHPREMIDKSCEQSNKGGRPISSWPEQTIRCSTNFEIQQETCQQLTSLKVTLSMRQGRMTYFTWRESCLTADCSSLEAMAARFEESASLMRRMSSEGFQLERSGTEQRITHPDPTVFEAWGFVSEESPVRQLTLIPDLQN